MEAVNSFSAQYLAANPVKQAMILKTVVSNLVFDGATITPTYRKPFDVLAERPSSGNWLPVQDTTRTSLTQLTAAQASRVRQFERLVA